MKRFAFLAVGLAASFYQVHAHATESTLGQNAILSFGQSLVSPGCAFHLDMQGDGNLVLYRGVGTGWPLWATNTRSPYQAQAVMQADGNLLVEDALGRVLWASWTQGRPGSYATLQDDGNFVVYNGNSPLWASWTNGEVIGQSPCELKSSITQTYPDTKYLGTFGGGQGNMTPLKCSGYLEYNKNNGACVAAQYLPPGAPESPNPSISWCMCMASIYWAVPASGYTAMRINN